MTEQKSARDRLQALLKVSEEAQDSVIITDKNGVIEYVNPYFSDISGYSPKDAIGQRANLIRSDAVPPHVFAEMWKVIMSGQRWCGDLLNKRKNGSLYLDRVTIWPIVNEEGVISHFVARQKCLDKTPDVPAETGSGDAGTAGT
jgi:PAS domain S-box-containing protein